MPSMCASVKTDERRHVFILGCKGIPARYGGFETFADHLVRGSRDPGIVWHVACQLSGEGADVTSAATAWSQMDQTFTTHPEGEEIGTVFFIRVHTKLGKAKAIFYDVDAMTYAIEYCEKHPEIKNPVFYLLAYRIGPWMGHFRRRIHRLGGQLYLNPDGHEWMRRKWSRPVRIYWKLSEILSVRKADKIVCDSRAIKDYIDRKYHHKDVVFIPYGADIPEGMGRDSGDVQKGSGWDPVEARYQGWLSSVSASEGRYCLCVGRFVPENNYDIIIREFMSFKADMKLILITTSNDELKAHIDEQTGFSGDSRIQICTPLYDEKLLTRIRAGSFAYIHGHEVGGTNPSLLESLAASPLCLVLDVPFNREVTEDSALYWNKEPGSMREALERASGMSGDELMKLRKRAEERIEEDYSWPSVIEKYETLFK